MNYKFILITSLLFILNSIFLSGCIPFTGDEFFTLDIDSINKPFPYKIFVSSILSFVSPNPSNIFILRFTSVFFMILMISLFYIFFTEGKKEKMVLLLLLVSNSFVLREAIFFRYYSYYLLSSVVVMILLKKLYYFSTNQKLIFSFIGAIFSPYFLFILNSLQFIYFFLFTFIFFKLKRNIFRAITVTILGLCLIGLIIEPIYVWKLLDLLSISDHANININSVNTRGFSFSILMKPIYAVYQMFFGYFLAATESILLLILFGIISSILLKIGWGMYKKNKEEFWYLIVIGLLPFISIYYLFEVISLPGFTQLESKHGMLFFPVIIVLVLKSYKYLHRNTYYLFIVCILFCQLNGLYYSYNIKHTDWEFIAKEAQRITQKNDACILIDGRSRETFDFYSESEESNLIFTWESIESIRNKIENQSDVILLLNDFKSFNSLTLNQNWNAGEGSSGRVSELSEIFNLINEKHSVKYSYVNYPTFFYHYTSKNDSLIGGHSNIWTFQYKDLQFPVNNQDFNNEIKTSVLIKPGSSESIFYTPRLVFNIESTDGNVIEYGKSVGELYAQDFKIDLIKGENIWNVFSDYFGENLMDAKVFYSWNHRPFVSGSIRYSGSIYKHKANIYYIDIPELKSDFLKIKNTSNRSNIRIWL